MLKRSWNALLDARVGGGGGGGDDGRSIRFIVCGWKIWTGFFDGYVLPTYDSSEPRV